MVMKITSIEKTKKGRYSLFVNGEFVFSVSADQIISDRIAVDKEVTSDDLRQMLSNSQRLYAKQRAVNLLSARSYTRNGLGKKLLEIADAQTVEEILDYFENMGYIDDRDYATRKASDLYNIKRYGRSRVVAALIQKGIDKNLAQEIAMEQEPDDTQDKVLSIIEKKYTKLLKDVTDRQELYKNKSKVFGAMVRMGYGYDDVNSAIQRFLDEK